MGKPFFEVMGQEGGRQGSLKSYGAIDQRFSDTTRRSLTELHDPRGEAEDRTPGVGCSANVNNSWTENFESRLNPQPERCPCLHKPIDALWGT
jgi:hypothetical protein